jgi:chromosome partitioning protein
MISVLVANTKGGCGKTTLATNLAAAFAVSGHATAMADADRQRSALGWLRRRPKGAAPISGLDWTKGEYDLPHGITRLVIDAPAALKIKEVEALLKLADAVILPVLPSTFDADATHRFLSRLEALKPIRKSRAVVAIVGNRVRARTRAASRLEAFLEGLGQRVATRLSESAVYTDLAADGLGLSDLSGRRVAGLRAEWDPLLDLIERIPEE